MNKEKMLIKRVTGFQGLSEQLEALCECITQDLEALEVEREKALHELQDGYSSIPQDHYSIDY